MTGTDKTNHKIGELDQAHLLQVAQTLGVALAVVDQEEWNSHFENANFFKWFPPVSDADEPPPAWMPKFKPERALACLEAGRAYRFEFEAQFGVGLFRLRSSCGPFPMTPPISW